MGDRRPSDRLLVNGILGQTAAVVRSALRGNWEAAVMAAGNRRILLRGLEVEALSMEEGSKMALRQAVEESERALELIIARPLAGL